MSSLGDLLIRLRMDSADLESDSGRAAHIVERDMERMVARATAAGELIGGALSNIALHFKNMVVETLKAGDELARLSERSGFAVERLSELKFAGNLADVSMATLATSLGFFNKALADASNESSRAGQTFKALGVDISSGPQAAFEQFNKAINQLPDAELKVAAMRIAFGRAADVLLPLIGSLDQTTAKAREMGLVMSEDLARNSERFNQAMQTLAAQSNALLLPALTKDASALATIAEEFSKATTAGERWLAILKETDKLVISTFGALVPGFDKLAEEQFKAYEYRANRTGGGSGAWGDPDVEVPPPDAAAVRAAVSGQRDKASRRAMDEQARYLAEMEKLDMESRARSAQAQLDDADALQKKLAEIRAREIKAMDDQAEEEMRVRNKAEVKYFENEKRVAEENARTMDKATRDADRSAEQFGLTMSSALGKIIREGGNARDAIRALGQDLAQLVTRLAILNPLAQEMAASFKGMGGTTGILGSLGLGGLFGRGGISDAEAIAAGGSVIDGNLEGALLGSFASGTDRVPRTGTYLLHEGEKVLRRGETAAGGGTYYIDARGADQAALARLERVVQSLGGQVRAMPATIADMNRRGGSFHTNLR